MQATLREGVGLCEGDRSANRPLKRVQRTAATTKQSQPHQAHLFVQDVVRKHDVCMLASIKLKLSNFKETKCFSVIRGMCYLTGACLHRHTCARWHIGTCTFGHTLTYTHPDSRAAAHPGNTFTFRNAFSSPTPPLSLAEGLCQTQKALLPHTWTACWVASPCRRLLSAWPDCEMLCKNRKATRFSTHLWRLLGPGGLGGQGLSNA